VMDKVQGQVQGPPDMCQCGLPVWSCSCAQDKLRWKRRVKAASARGLYDGQKGKTAALTLVYKHQKRP